MIADALNGLEGGEGKNCRLLIGMPVDQERNLGEQLSLTTDGTLFDQATAKRKQLEMARKFRDQLMLGAPTSKDEAGLKKLLAQLMEGKLTVKLHLRYPLHAKLYMAFRDDHNNPVTSYVGSSNLTFAGLKAQGELNVDVLDHDANEKLQIWFEDRWNDRFSVDFTDLLVEVIEESWITIRSPYEIYIKMAYHLSREARVGIETFEIPREFRSLLYKFQEAAVQIAAHHLDKRGGVLIGDVVGLGKTMMASALVKSYTDRHNVYPLIICPPNLESMWKGYDARFDLRARILSSGKLKDLAGEFTRHKLVVIDESHNLRNRETKNYGYIKKYIGDMDASVILLSATPYNKSYVDISSQLRLFLNEDKNLGIRPEEYISSFPNGEADFAVAHQCPTNTILAFEQSPFTEDWQQLMQKFMVRRTRTFIKRHYTDPDPLNGREYLLLADGTRNYFPERKPHTVKFEFNESSPDDAYARLYHQSKVDLINSLELPRYGYALYLTDEVQKDKNGPYWSIVEDLSRAGKRLKAFCRVNLYKRLESCGESFLLSVERHIARNYMALFALDNGLPIPIGPQAGWVLDSALNDAEDALEADDVDTEASEAEEVSIAEAETIKQSHGQTLEAKLKDAGRRAYETLQNHFKNRFHWLPAECFNQGIKALLAEDSRKLTTILVETPEWIPEHDCKLEALRNLLTHTHKADKVLIFTEFADTAKYLQRNLAGTIPGILECAIGGHGDVSEVARRFSPKSNRNELVDPHQETRVVIATDVLSEGQNLQDCHVVVNFDLPWTLIRLVQRAGRVDRIGQDSETIDCYSFVPMKGIEGVIHLRSKIRTRMRENAEVVGSDEEYFDDEENAKRLLELYNEKSGVLDGEEDESEVDLQSRALAIYEEAIAADPSLAKRIEKMPDVVFSAKPRQELDSGVVVYVKTPDDTDALAFVGKSGESLTENQSKILAMAACEADTPTMAEPADHHDQVQTGVKHLLLERASSPTGTLGKKNGARYKAYVALKAHLAKNEGSLMIPPEMVKALDLLLKSPLKESAAHTLNDKFRANADDEQIAELVTLLFNEHRLCHSEEEDGALEPKIICSMSLV